jgi:serine/threonine protein kinase
MDLDRFLRIAIQIATALSTIHRDGLVHLNIRPENVACDPETGDAALKAAPD